MMKCYKMKEIPYLRILGRSNDSCEPVTLFWTASGIEMNIKATEAWIIVHSDYEMFEPWADVIIDGALTQRMMVNKGEQRICLFRNMEGNKIRNVKILRDTPAFPTDEKTLFQISEVQTDGKFYPLEEPKMKLEFVGDSITSGEGGCGAGTEMTWNSFCFNCVDNYAYMTAKKLNAVYNCVSQSGWGVYCSWEGNEQQAIPLYYDQVCGVLNGEQNKVLGALEKWDFSRFQPDVIVVNLGTNDSVGTKNMEKVERAVEGFLKKIRDCNPESYILWCYGMLGDEICSVLENAVQNYKVKTGDARVEFVKLPDTLAGEFGSRQHPGHISHEKAAKVLAEKIQGLTNAMAGGNIMSV